ncbi:MAG TPA: metalloregulator ArsR/SmtB family transcription factor [Pseudoflavonifractor sp.]|nr:metalloregulator ArsR/SmtB family transcription factor [Pseudoflavonifractor sp.]
MRGERVEQNIGQYEEKAALLKALAHPLRLQIVRGLLKDGCHNVSCMEAGLGQSQPCISQHLMRLKAAGVVKASRSGNEVYYDLSDREGVSAVVAALFGDREGDYVQDV